MIKYKIKLLVCLKLQFEICLILQVKKQIIRVINNGNLLLKEFKIMIPIKILIMQLFLNQMIKEYQKILENKYGDIIYKINKELISTFLNNVMKKVKLMI